MKAVRVARIDYTIEVRRGRHEILIRKSKMASASEANLPAAIERALRKLSDVGAFSIQVSYKQAGS